MSKNYTVHLWLLVILLLCLNPILANAQDRTISGKVVDENSDPLPGVSVLIKGTTTGGTTDFDGNYRLNIPSGQVTLVFSYIGYTAQDVTVTTQTTLDIQMEVDAEQLEEVVVIGYGSVKKEDATGSIVAVSASDFNQGALTTPQEQLQGKVAGVSVTTSGGAPGSGATIRIRGGSSLSASNDPLIVIDGVPVDNEGINGMSNPLSAVNPNDIETFTVLKDASATAIYGSRASNGVIIITTKSGSNNRLGFNYNGNVSIATVPKYVDIYDAAGFRNIIRNRFGEGSRAESFLGPQGTDTDWQREIFSSAVSTDHNVSLSGSIAEVLPFRASVGYTYNDGILNTSNMNRTTANLNLTPKFFDDHLSVNASVKFMDINNRFADTGAIGSALAMDPTHAPRGDEFSQFGGYFTWLDDSGNPITIAPSNPLALLEQKRDKSDAWRTIGNIQLDYKFHFLPELRANLNIGTDRSFSEGTNVVGTEAGFIGGQVGQDNSYTQKKYNDLLDFYLQYGQDIRGGSKFDIMLGYSWQHFWRREFTKNQTLDGGNLKEQLFKTENYLVSFFGRFNFDLKGKYLFTFTLRNDGTSRFSEDTRWGLFPSVAFGWNMAKESFLASSNTVSTLKLKLGYGVTGQQNIGQGDYPYLARYTFNENTQAQTEIYVNQGGTWVPQIIGTLRPEGYDANIKWEETVTYNVGVEFGFAQDKYTGTLDFYLRDTKDLLNTIPVPAGSNLVDQLLTNVGDLRNKGVELGFNGKFVQTSDWFFNLGVNFTYNNNEITRLTQVDDPNYQGVLTGGIGGGTGNTIQIHSVGHPANSFYVWQQVYDQDGNHLEGVYVDRNGDGEITDDDKYRYKDPAPNYLAGITAKLGYRNWDFSFGGRMNFNNYVYNNFASQASLNGAFTDVGYTANQSVDLDNTGFNQPQFFSDYFVQNASFFRMDNMSLGYSFNSLGSKNNMNLRLSFTANNVFVITDYEGLDPEIFGGIDNNVYPRPRIFLLGVNFGF